MNKRILLVATIILILVAFISMLGAVWLPAEATEASDNLWQTSLICGIAGMFAAINCLEL